MVESHERRLIFHIDMDSFYASCELARRPESRDLPFVVGADPRGGAGRGVVLACNYPARKYGVRSGMPISKAWGLCPNAKYVLPDHSLYWEVSKRVMNILKSFSEKMEQVSVDEAFLDLTDDLLLTSTSGTLRKNAITSIASQIKKKVFEAEKITCSIGVSSSKVTSKIATDMNKPDGLTVVEPEEVVHFLSPLPVEKIPGIGKVTQRKLFEAFAVTTIGDLAKIPLEDLNKEFGRSGMWFHNVSLGLDRSEVVSRWDPVSESSETTFEEDEEDYKKVSDTMKGLAAEVVDRVIEDHYKFRNVGIKIRFTGFETHTRSRSLAAPTDSLKVVVTECERMLAEFEREGKSVRLIGVRLSQLEKLQSNESQRSLLEWSDQL